MAVGVDFSSEADLAVREAREIARHLAEDLVLVHAASQDDVVGDAGGQLDEMRARHVTEGIAIRRGVINGPAGFALSDAAHELDADMIVVGTHGYAGLARLLAGSVSQRVIRTTDVDVLVARDPQPPRGGYRRIMVATDLSASSSRAFERALALAAPDAVVEVVHFYRRQPPPEIFEAAEAMLGVQVVPETLARMIQRGQSFVGARRATGPRVMFYLVEQPPLEGILHWLESAAFDLVVLGSHGRRGMKRLLLGSVAEAVARRAGCSVMIARGLATEEAVP